MDIIDQQLHDDLALATACFKSTRILGFYGRSGAGKSSAMQWMINHHAEFKTQSANAKTWLMIDEILTWRDLIAVWRGLVNGHRVLIASHLKPIWFSPFLIFGKQRWYRLDHRTDKIKKYFTRHQIKASDDAIHRFIQQYGANYTDAQIILERAQYNQGGEIDFDFEFKRFKRENKIHHHSPDPHNRTAEISIINR